MARNLAQPVSVMPARAELSAGSSRQAILGKFPSDPSRSGTMHRSRESGIFRQQNSRGPACGPPGRVAGGGGDMSQGPTEVDVTGKKGRGPERLVEPVSLLGLNLGEVLLGL